MIAELIKTFETTVKFTEQSVSDLSEAQMVEQPAGVPNHAQWTRRSLRLPATSPCR
jgi:hypothetical protein